METVIKAGWGFNVGQDFARANEDTPIEIDCVRDSDTFGYIAANPKSTLGFLRGSYNDSRVRVRVQTRGLETR